MVSELRGSSVFFSHLDSAWDMDGLSRMLHIMPGSSVRQALQTLMPVVFDESYANVTRRNKQMSNEDLRYVSGELNLPPPDAVDTSAEQVALMCMYVSRSTGESVWPADWRKRVNDVIRALKKERDEYRKILGLVEDKSNDGNAART